MKTSYIAGTPNKPVTESGRESAATWRVLFVTAAMGALLAGCASADPPKLASADPPALDVCKSPWAFVGNNGGKNDRPAVAREMAAAHCL